MKTKFVIIAGLSIFHCLISTVMSMVAQSSIMADYHNGQGLWNFAMDSFLYHEYAIHSYSLLQNEGYAVWLDSSSFRHSKLVGLLYYLIYPSPLSFAPANALAWSLSLICVYLIAMILYKNNQKLSMITALIFGLWPSNLLIGTQLLRDPFYNLGILMMLLGWIAILHGKRKVVYSLLVSCGLIFSTTIRPEPFWLLIMVSLLALGIVALRERRSLLYAFLALLLIAIFYNYPAITAYAGENGDNKVAAYKEKVRHKLGEAYTPRLDARISKWFEVTRYSPWKDFDIKTKKLDALIDEHGRGLDLFLAKWMTPWQYSRWLPKRVEHTIVTANRYRNGFLVWYLKPGTSLIDSDVQFKNVDDVIAYIPRAMMIGFFAPFPDQWFVAGKTGGKAIRVLGGIEMVAWYALMVGFAFFLVRSGTPLRIKVWLLLFTVVLILPLGLFVPNVGTLFRMRFIYMVPILIAGIEGWVITLQSLNITKKVDNGVGLSR